MIHVRRCSRSPLRTQRHRVFNPFRIESVSQSFGRRRYLDVDVFASAQTFRPKQDGESLSADVKIRTFRATFELVKDGREGGGKVLLERVDDLLLRRQRMRFHVFEIRAESRERRQTGDRREYPG